MLKVYTNDLWIDNRSALQIHNNIVGIVEALSAIPDVKIFVQTLPPQGETTAMTIKINECNSLLKNSENHKMTILDLHALFVGVDGYIKKEYTTDGVHLSEAAYDVWANYLRNYLDP